MSNPAAATAPPAAAPAANNKTILGAAAPQLRELLKQPPGGQPPGGQPPGGQPQAGSNAAGGSHTQGGAQAQSKFCGRCGKPMQFVAQYQRWFCQGCQQYA
jgi:NADH pyrophosphatase NudC (nudix superfamily)